jgi:hypothetical protein
LKNGRILVEFQKLRKPQHTKGPYFPSNLPSTLPEWGSGALPPWQGRSWRRAEQRYRSFDLTSPVGSAISSSPRHRLTTNGAVLRPTLQSRWLTAGRVNSRAESVRGSSNRAPDATFSNRQSSQSTAFDSFEHLRRRCGPTRATSEVLFMAILSSFLPPQEVPRPHGAAPGLSASRWGVGCRGLSGPVPE